MITFLFVFVGLTMAYAVLVSYLLFKHVTRYNKEVQNILLMLTSGAINQVQADKRLRALDTVVKLSLQDDARF